MSNKVRPHINQLVGLLKFTVLILTAFIVTAAPAAEALTAQERRSFANRGIYFIDDPCAFGAGSTVDLTGNDNAEKAFNFFVKNAGFSPDEAAGIVGNLIQESGVNPESDNPAAADIGGGGGIAQWEGGRWIALQEFAAEKGVPWSDLALQLAFIVEELGTTQGRAKKAMDALNDEGINADLLRSLLSSVLNHQLTSYENEMLDKLKAETNNATLSPARIAAVTFSITYERPQPVY